MEGLGAFFAALLTLPLLGCASSRNPGSESGEGPADGPTAERTSADVDEALEDMGADVCVLRATVTVHVWNEGSAAVQLTFGSYAPVRLAEPFSRSIYNVARPYLRRPITIRIARGGLQVGPSSRIQTEPVVCNAATLVIGARPRYSVFYGDAILGPSDLRAAREEDEAEEAPADSTSDGEG